MRVCLHRSQQVSATVASVLRVRWTHLQRPLCWFSSCEGRLGDFEADCTAGVKNRTVMWITALDCCCAPHSAVVGSMMVFTSEIRLAGNPPCCACSRTMASFGAL